MRLNGHKGGLPALRQGDFGHYLTAPSRAAANELIVPQRQLRAIGDQAGLAALRADGRHFAAEIVERKKNQPRVALAHQSGEHFRKYIGPRHGQLRVRQAVNGIDAKARRFLSRIFQVYASGQVDVLGAGQLLAGSTQQQHGHRRLRLAGQIQCFGQHF